MADVGALTQALVNLNLDDVIEQGANNQGLIAFAGALARSMRGGATQAQLVTQVVEHMGGGPGARLAVEMAVRMGYQLIGPGTIAVGGTVRRLAEAISLLHPDQGFSPEAIARLDAQSYDEMVERWTGYLGFAQEQGGQLRDYLFSRGDSFEMQSQSAPPHAQGGLSNTAIGRQGAEQLPAPSITDRMKGLWGRLASPYDAVTGGQAVSSDGASFSSVKDPLGRINPRKTFAAGESAESKRQAGVTGEIKAGRTLSRRLSRSDMSTQEPTDPYIRAGSFKTTASLNAAEARRQAAISQGNDNPFDSARLGKSAEAFGQMLVNVVLQKDPMEDVDPAKAKAVTGPRFKAGSSYRLRHKRRSPYVVGLLLDKPSSRKKYPLLL